MSPPRATLIRRLRGRFLAAVVCVLAPQDGLPGVLGPSGQNEAPLSQAAGRPPSQAAPVDVVVLDTRGQPILGLQSADFSVTLDGTPRRVVSTQYVFRGPGARAAAAQLTAAGGGLRPTAETSRTVLVAVDEASLVRGDERQVQSIVSRLLDRLGPADSVAVALLPARDTRIALTTDRETALEALRQVAGRAVWATSSTGPALPEPMSDTLAPGKKGVEGDAQPRRETRDPRGVAAPGDAPLNEPGSQSRPGVTDTVTGVQQLIDGLRPLPGPKAIVLVSSGLLVADRSSAIDQTGAAAAAARVTLHVLFRRVAGWRPPLSGSNVQTGSEASRPDVAGAALTSLAVMTGGTLLEVGRNIDQVVEPLTAGLSGAYMVTIETDESDRDGKAHDLRVAVRRAGVKVVRARHQWLPRDEPLPAAPAAAAPDIPVEARPAPLRTVPAPSASRPSSTARDDFSDTPDSALRVLLASVSEYLSAYERDLSAVVAEEHYWQAARYRRPGLSSTKDVTVDLRSDFLMVRTPAGEEWIPFRDVFEVNGVPVRDREDRLKRLFLENPSTAMLEARKINDESARYNAGTIERNVNVPTLPLTFLRATNQWRFVFKRRGEETVDGLRAWRVDCVERATPTLINTGKGKDVPATGSFWVDPANGRIVKTLLRASTGTVQMDTTVVYRSSDALGIWVPAEMKEKYVAADLTVEGQATYSNFRRFRVLTSEELKIPKDQRKSPGG